MGEISTSTLVNSTVGNTNCLRIQKSAGLEKRKNQACHLLYQTKNVIQWDFQRNRTVLKTFIFELLARRFTLPKMRGVWGNGKYSNLIFFFISRTSPSENFKVKWPFWNTFIFELLDFSSRRLKLHLIEKMENSWVLFKGRRSRFLKSTKILPCYWELNSDHKNVKLSV